MGAVLECDCLTAAERAMAAVLRKYSHYLITDKEARREAGTFAVLLDQEGFEIREKTGKCNSSCVRPKNERHDSTAA